MSRLLDKKPWCMTRDEFYQPIGRLPRNWKKLDWKIEPEYGEVRIVITPKRVRFHLIANRLYRPFNTAYHEHSVKMALQSGKRVFKRVLRDYPHLAEAIREKGTHVHVRTGRKFRKLISAINYERRTKCKKRKTG